MPFEIFCTPFLDTTFHFLYVFKLDRVSLFLLRLNSIIQHFSRNLPEIQTRNCLNTSLEFYDYTYLLSFTSSASLICLCWHVT